MQGCPGNLLISFVTYELGMLLIQNLVSQSKTLLTQYTIFLQLYFMCQHAYFGSDSGFGDVSHLLTAEYKEFHQNLASPRLNKIMQI
jgi:hypothetical protein